MWYKSFLKFGVAVSLLVGACNIFNPSGEGDLPDNPEGMVSVGQTRLRNQDYDGAMEAFEKAIKADSTNSLAYYGYCKAVRLKYDLNGLSLSKEITDTSKGSLPFIDLPISTANSYYQATWRSVPLLQTLIHRDSLQRYYKTFFKQVKEYQTKYDRSLSQYRDRYCKEAPFYYKNKSPKSPFFSKTDRLDTLCVVAEYMDSARVQKQKYGVSSFYDSTQYPLMDGVINLEKVTTDYALLLMLHTLVSLKDLNGDKLIDSTDKVEVVEDLLKLFTAKEGSGEQAGVGNIEQKLATFMEKQKGDTATVSQINNLLDKMSEGTEGVAQMIDFATTLGIVPQTTDTSSKDACDSSKTAECKQQGALGGDIKEQVAALGNKVVFYKFGDKLDNDGDGCVDEEILDGIDNDGDGLIDEDTRLIPYDTPDLLTGKTASLGSWIKPDSSDNNKAVLNPLTDRVTFTEEAGFWPADTSESLNYRFKILEHTKDQKPPYTITALQLQDARKYIGGCWNKYK